MALRPPLQRKPCVPIYFVRFRYIVGDENGQVVRPPPSDMTHDVGNGLVVRRVIQPIDELMQKPLAKAAKLTREEVIAIVMYTGPAFVLYNAVLRRFPANIYSVFKDSGNLFPTTIFVLVSAVNKLSRCMNIAHGTLLFRGLGGTMEFPDRFARPDPSCATPNALGYLEFGFMSTTADRTVAVQYSGVKDGKPKAGILQVQPNSVDRGADISEFSQYPGEKEYLFVPYSFVQGEGRQRAEVDGSGGVLTIVPVRVNINLKTETVEELKDKKKRMHLVSARAMVEEVRYELQQWASCEEALDRLQRDDSRNKKGGPFSTETLAAAIVKQCVLALKRHEDTCVEEYVDDGIFRSLVSEMLDIKAWALEKKNLWMNDMSQYIWYLQGWSLRECHRLWLSFLNNNIAKAEAGLSDRARDSVKLLVSRGLVMRGVRGEVNADGEDVLVQAGGDGWTARDIRAAAFAGADADATDEVGRNGICNAARYGHLESITALVEVRADVNKCDKYGRSAIYMSSRNGMVDCLRTLIAAGADANMCSEDGRSPIYVAATFDFPKCIELLVAANGDVNKCQDDTRSPIFTAASYGKTSSVAQLLSSRADPRSSFNGVSAVDEARSRGHKDCARLLEDAMQ